jgi:ketosteroid isomerase-like protein
MATVWTVLDGEIVKGVSYNDPREAVTAVGLSG